MALLIRGGQIMNRTQMGLEPADVLIEADQIVAVGCELSIPPGTEELNAAGHLILPGLINAHTHAHMFEAMRFAALVNTVRFPHDQEHWIGARDVYDMATQGSARILGLADDIGAVAPGRKADLVLLRANSVYLQPLHQPLNALVYAENGAAVATVLVGGQVVLDQGQVLTVDEGHLQTQAQDAADRLHAQNTAARALARRLRPYVAAACRAAVATPYSVNRYAAPIMSDTNPAPRRS